MIIKVIKDDTLIPLALPGLMYYKLQEVLALKFKDLTPEQTVQKIKELTDMSLQTPELFELRVLTALIKSIEEVADREKLFEEVESDDLL
jgi:hypothetical protein